VLTDEHEIISDHSPADSSLDSCSVETNYMDTSNWGTSELGTPFST